MSGKAVGDHSVLFSPGMGDMPCDYEPSFFLEGFF
jgi:hypothetical protein